MQVSSVGVIRRAGRLLFLAVAAAFPAQAGAQTEPLPATQQLSPGPVQHGLTDSGWVRVATALDVLADSGGYGEGYRYAYTAAGPMLGVQVGVTEQWFWDAGGTLHVGGGTFRFNQGKRLGTSFLGAHVHSSIGRQSALRRWGFVMPYAGVGWGSVLLSSNETDGLSPDRFDDQTISLTAVAGAVGSLRVVDLANDNTVWLCPSLGLGYAWSVRNEVTTGGSPPPVTRRDVPSFLTQTVGFDVGDRTLGLYFGVLWQHTPPVEDDGSHETVIVRLNWSLRVRGEGR